MTPKNAFTLNVALGALAVGLATYIGWEVLGPGPSAPSAARGRTGAPAAVTTVPARPPAEPPGAWSVIATRNPFSPSRSDSPVASAQAGQAAINVPKPNLYGIVLKDNGASAYIEDPQTKRVAAYRVGDAIAGGTVQKIARDGIVLTRPDGTLDVRLHDPGKPRPALPSPPPGGAPTQPLPGVVPPAQQPQAQPQAQAPAEPQPQPGLAPPSVEPPAAPIQRPPTRRPLPPNLLRRLPQPQPSDDQNR